MIRYSPGSAWCQRLRPATRRRGAVLVAALVCLLVVMAVIAAMLQSALRSRRYMQTERDVRQAELLLRAGIVRAAQRMRADEHYSGEQWQLAAAEIVGLYPGQVTVEVASTDHDQTRRVYVLAEYPLGNQSSVRRSRTLVLEIPKTSQED